MENRRLPLVYGLYMAAAAIAYFLILSLFGLHRHPVLSVVNLAIYGVGQFMLVSKFKAGARGTFKYEEGFWAMFRAGVIATIVICIFFLLYITELTPGFLQELLTTWKEEYDLRVGPVILGIALMGISTSLVFSLVHMQLFKPSWNTKEGKKHTL